jgi:hypothetical protein
VNESCCTTHDVGIDMSGVKHVEPQVMMRLSPAFEMMRSRAVVITMLLNIFLTVNILLGYRSYGVTD